MKILVKCFLVLVSFFVVAGFSFLLMRCQSNRPLQSLTTNSNFSQHSISVYSPDYISLYHQYGFSKAAFYFSISNLALPDSFKYFPETPEKDFLIKWSCTTGDPVSVYQVYKSLYSFHLEEWNVPPSQVLGLQRIASNLTVTTEFDSLSSYFAQFKKLLPKQSTTALLLNDISEIKIENRFLQLFPVINLNSSNQFLVWCQDLFNKEGGVYTNSWYTKESVRTALKKPFLITFLISFLSMFFILITSILLSCELFLLKDKKIVKCIYAFITFLYSVPAFFVGAILIYFFSNPLILDLLPSNFSFSPFCMSEDGWLISVFNSWNYFILPVYTLSFGAIIFFVILLYQSFEIEFSKNYVLSAKMMGASVRNIIYKQVLKNAIYSSSTFLFLLFPALLSGSLVVEQLYSISGIGNLLMSSARNQDVPVLITLFGFIGAITAFSFFVLDFYQKKINGRILIRKI